MMRTNKGTEKESAMLIELTEQELDSMCGGSFDPFMITLNGGGDITTHYDFFATLTGFPLNSSAS